MEPSSRPRHQIRAQGRRRGGAGIVIVQNDTSRLRWHPGGNQPVSTGTIVAAKPESKTQKSHELLEFISRTAVQSEKELLSNLEETVTCAQVDSADGAGSLSEFRRIIANVQKNERSAFRQIRTTTESRAITPGLPPVDAVYEFATSNLANPANLLHQGYVGNVLAPIPPAVDAGEGKQSGQALRSLLNELDDWLSAGLAPSQVVGVSALYSTPTSPGSANSSTSFASQPSLAASTSLTAPAVTAPNDAAAYAPSAQARRQTAPDETTAKSHADEVDQSQIVTARMPVFNAEQIQSQRRFGFDQKRDWNYDAPATSRQNSQQEPVRSKLSPLLEAARRMVVGVKNLPLGRRIESHENGAILEKDELGRVTQIRAQSGEIISVYYGRDGAPEGFVRTDARGVLHSVAECDAQGVVLRDENGRVRAAGDSIAIDPLGRISICRSDGQYWSIDLARQMLSEKRRLSDPTGQWTALTAVFAADGFRMMTLFQKLTPSPEKLALRSQADINRVWSRAAVEAGHFRFYGRDGSTIEFDSEENLVGLMPTHVSSPGVRPIEPRWRSSHQAGTAWQSVHEYVVSYLAI